MTSGVTSTSSQTYSSGSTTSTSSNSSVSENEFLQLLTEQLKSQDPLKPYDNQEFASQLAQFSQLEQLTDIKSLLQSQVTSNQALSQTMTNSALPGMLGKSAKAKMSSFTYDGSSSVKLAFDLTSAANNANVVIKNSNGTVVRTYQLSGTDLKSGEHTIEWDGKNNAGETADSGNYSVTVNAVDSSGSSEDVSTYIQGTIQSVKFTSDGTKLVVNGTEVALSDISDINLGS